jgi:hypothetical protein
MFNRILAAALLACAAPAPAQPFDPAPWLEDLEQMRQAFHKKYANREWLETERELKLNALFSQAAAAIRNAPDDAAVRSLFERLPRKLGDGHVAIDWPKKAASASVIKASAPSSAPDLCSQLGYNSRQNRPGTAQALPSYQALTSDRENPFTAGTVSLAGQNVGVLRIGIFQPQGYPGLCSSAVRALAIPADRPCDESCEDEVLTWAYRRMTGALEDRVRQLKAAGASVLVVDITNNGGGSEWAEAAARIFSSKLLVSQRRGFVRGEHWAKQWQFLASQLREQAANAPKQDRERLLAWAAEADAALREAQSPCPSSSCIAKAGYATGLVGSARSGEFAGKHWAAHVFNPAQFPYHDGVWSGPLIVLVDQETWSAAEQFAAVLQDNKAAIIIGARTGGAGCGYTWGGMPTVLKNSGAVLKLPDCVRFRADGSNEVRGIIPDEAVAVRADDGARFRASLIAEKLPVAIARAQSLQTQKAAVR